MPFTIGGDYVPERPDYSKKTPKTKPQALKPTSTKIKVFSEKRKNTYITIIKNLPLSHEEEKELTSYIKKKLGCGGSYKDTHIEIQGNKLEDVKNILKSKGFKV